jgi:hypothetical protein
MARKSRAGHMVGTLLIAVIGLLILHSIVGAQPASKPQPTASTPRYVVVHPADAGFAELFGGCPTIAKPGAWWDCVGQHADQIAHPEKAKAKAKAKAKHRRHSPTATTRGGADELG